MSGGTAVPTLSSRVVAPRDVDAALLDGWKALAGAALEPNPFFEPWALQPALEHFDSGEVQLLLIERALEGGAAQLVGLAPVIERRRVLGLMRVRQVWTQTECYLGTPLVHADCPHEAATAIALWLTDGAVGRIERLHAAGPVAHAVLDAAPELRLEFVALDRYSRALCDTGAAPDAAAYLARSISSKHRKELRRQHNRLADVADGAPIVALTDGAELDAWVEEFLTLEAKGWKSEGAALRTKPGGEAWFRAMCHRAWDEGRLEILALRNGSRPLAMKCNLLAPPGSFAIKITFDEEFARFSPGTHLELYNVERLYDSKAAGVRWMDSCASRRRWLVDRMWGERRSTETLLLARTRSRAAALLHLMPVVIWVRRVFGAAH